MKTYIETIHLIERLHRTFLELVKAELDQNGISDVNNVQALILCNIGDDTVTVGELTNRGYYLGSNVSYNVKKMVENKYLEPERSPHDKRSIRLIMTEKGKTLCQKMTKNFELHTEQMSKTHLKPEDLLTANAIFKKLEDFWMGKIGHALPDATIEE